MSLNVGKAAIAALAGILLLSAGAIAAESVYTATSGKTCRKLPEAHLSGHRCKGPNGMSFVVLDDGNVVGVQFVLPVGRRSCPACIGAESES